MSEEDTQPVDTAEVPAEDATETPPASVSYTHLRAHET